MEIEESDTSDFLEALNKEISPNPSVLVSSYVIKNKQIIILDVPEGANKPYVYSGRSFVRIGVSVKELKIKKNARVSPLEKPYWESLPATGISIEDLDHHAILRMIGTAKKERLASNFKGASVKEILKYLNLLANDVPTNAAFVLFGKEPHRVFPQICIHCVQFAGKDRTNMLELPPPFEGNLFSLLDQAKNFLEAKLPRIIKTRANNIIRESTFLIPIEAWQEALINALCHRDYLDITGRINISLFKDRLEIWNNGKLPSGMSLEMLKQNHTSRPTNPIIAKIFFLSGLIDAVGRGTNRILDSCVRAGLSEPTFSLHSGGIEVKILMVSPFTQNKRQAALLKRINIGESITLTDYRKQEGKTIKERQAREDLRQLTDHGYLRKERRGRATRYIRIK